MKIAHKIKLGMIILGLVGLFHSCDTTPAVAPIPVYEGTATHTIAQLLSMHEIGSMDSYVHIPEDGDPVVITGIVTTSDEHGNCYKYINIEDGTGGIQIKINNSALYHKYAVGQRIFVVCNGLDLGDYRKLPQLGMWANDAMQGIPSNRASSYIHLHNRPTNFEPIITLTEIPAADQIPAEYYNRLVRIEGATFAEGGAATYATANAATSHDINVAGGGTIVLRTSNYADFINELLPIGTGTVIGILTRYNNYVQLVIRDLNDVLNFVAPAHTENIFTVNYSNAFNEGWSQAGTGSSWNTLSNSSFSGFYIQGSENTDQWLISPVVNLHGAIAPVLSFSQRAPMGGSNAHMKLYYTTNYTGDVSSTTWNEVPLDNITTSTSNHNFEIPESAQSNTFRFAYRFNDPTNAWYLSNITISATITK